MHDEFLLLRRSHALAFHTLALLLGRRALAGGFCLQALLLDAGILEHLHRARHAADLVLALRTDDIGPQIAAGKPAHDLLQRFHRHDDPGRGPRKSRRASSGQANQDQHNGR